MYVCIKHLSFALLAVSAVGLYNFFKASQAAKAEKAY